MGKSGECENGTLSDPIDSANRCDGVTESYDQAVNSPQTGSPGDFYALKIWYVRLNG